MKKQTKHSFLLATLLLGLFAVSQMPTTTYALDGTTSKPLIKEQHVIGLKYNVYAGGIHALEATMDFNTSPDAYDVHVSANTQGFIGGLFPWSAVYTTKGHTEKGQLLPSLHKSKSVWKKSIKETNMMFSEDGQFEKAVEKEGSRIKTRDDVSDKLTLNAVDVLTATLQMLQTVSLDNNCNSTVPVFDGKRRFNLVFKKGKMTTLSKSKYSAYEGDALRCIVEVEPVAGFKKKDMKRGWLAVQNHTKERDKMPTIWLAQIAENTPMVPVRMEIASSYGTVVAHLSDIERHDSSLAQK